MADAIEVVPGKEITVYFEGRRCIHSRFCVLGRPDVFVSKVVGEWIHPDAAPVDAIVEIAHACPSGAILYTRQDGGPDEQAPAVNLVRVCENGPLAIHGDVAIEGHEARFRATLCRCGHSQHPPFCDRRHAEVGFTATGEPTTRTSEALPRRDGPVSVTPLLDGPLRVSGNIEIISGTGRTIDRLTTACLCRCGRSRNKPFCDDSHLLFRSEGAVEGAEPQSTSPP